jgi:DNA-binding MarR family transcriptional regulator
VTSAKRPTSSRQDARDAWALYRGVAKLAARQGLTFSQLATLLAVQALGPTCLTDLAAELGVLPSSLSRKRAPLIRRGLLRSRPGEDHRKTMISLTSLGEDTLSELFKEPYD